MHAGKWITLFTVILVIVGIGSNLLILVALITSKKNGKVISRIDVVFTVIDLAACVFFAVRVSPEDLNTSSDLLNRFICTVLVTRMTTWIFLSVRGMVNFLVALYHFIRLGFPFVEMQSIRWTFVTLAPTLIFGVVIMTVLATVYDSAYNKEENKCQNVIKQNFTLVKTSGLLLRFLALAYTMCAFIIPMAFSIFFYHSILKEMRKKAKLRNTVVFKDIHFRYIYDVWLYTACCGYAFFRVFMSKYLGAVSFDFSTHEYRIALFLMSAYCVIYPILSLASRSTYRTAVATLVKRCRMTEEEVDADWQIED
ncbi:unnamed protein product [Calicophoron daubneyi]|uniref:G-protein coupled receptors family 1 profile domain-containing protein n=1 Tax=Calicophoron daubneyi TaxID=300641 RepID=A0AAV2TDE4_CALDB